MHITVCYITPPFCRSLPLGLSPSPYYYLSCRSRLLPFPIVLSIRLACKAALGVLDVLGRSLKAYKESI
jgi:hypothetical protein